MDDKKIPTVFDGMNEQMMMSLVESLMPKLQSFIGPMYEKLNKYIIEGNRSIVIKPHMTPDGPQCIAVIVDNTKLFTYQTGDEPLFKGEQGSVQEKFIARQFVEMLLSGQLTKQMNENK